MSITIGARTLATARPADLDDQLVAVTGCTAKDHAEMLARSGTPFQIARALMPLVDPEEKLSRDDLVALLAPIAELDLVAVRSDLVALLVAKGDDDGTA